MNEKLKADILLVFVSISWGLAYPLVRNMMFYDSSSTILFLRCLIAVPFILIFYGKRLRKADKELICSGALAGTMMALAMTILLYALNYTSSFNSSIIVGLATPLTALFSALLIRKAPDKLTIIGIFICLIGTYIMGGGINFSLGFGDLLVMVSNILFIVQLLLIDKFNEKYDAASLGAVQVLTGFVISLIIWLISGDYHITPNKTIILGIAITGIIGLGFAFTFQTIAQKYTSPTHTSLILGLEPLFGAVFSLLIPNPQGDYETITFIKALGCIIVLAGVITAEVKSFNNPSPLQTNSTAEGKFTQ